MNPSLSAGKTNSSSAASANKKGRAIALPFLLSKLVRQLLCQIALQLGDRHAHLLPRAVLRGDPDFILCLSEVNPAKRKIPAPPECLHAASAAAGTGAPSLHICAQYASFSARYAFSSLIGTRTCAMVSRSRMVTQLSPAFSASPTVSKSTVMQKGVPISSSRR